MDYRKQLLHEAMDKVRANHPDLVAHVTDIAVDERSKSRDTVFWVVYKGKAYVIRDYNGAHKSWYHHNLEIWGVKASTKTLETKHAEVLDNIVKYLTSTLQYAARQD